jgi:hypothetical protein
LLGSVPSGITSKRFRAGVYTVTFTRPVADRLISSALGSNDLIGKPGSTSVVPAPIENPNTVNVITFNSAGAEEDRDFYVQMICP